MSTLTILKHPSKLLYCKSEPITKFNLDLRKLIEDMFETMYDANGVGLAGVQVGYTKRIFVMNCTLDREPKSEKVFINPEIVKGDGDQRRPEGCLSVPGTFVTKKRYHEVMVKAQDEHGSWFEETFRGLPALAIQHEYDHLEGRTIAESEAPEA